MPPLTRRSTGSIQQVRYSELISDSDVSSGHKATNSISARRHAQRSEDSEFDAASSQIKTDDSGSESSSQSDGVAEQERNEDRRESSKRDRSSTNVVWKPVVKLYPFPQSYFGLSESDILESVHYHLSKIPDWKKSLLEFCESRDSDEIFVVNRVLEFLAVKQVPPVHMFFNCSLRGVKADVIRLYFAKLQNVARQISSGGIIP
jgi:hypothetical protein